ncbi:unnamed protein product, partial [Mesorhabditis belari]|uniref:G-protein coupled receptors family 1 profile domain-containing protein n=1 Tax=Mesorhabditis belari TaxID=2138241 RepID=A0AAF3EMK5_9BILA
MGTGEWNGSCIPMQSFIKDKHNIHDVTADVYVKTIFIILYSFLFLFGLLGNGGVVLAMCGNRRLRSARNIFLLNLIITDLLLVLTAVPVTPWYALTKDWQFGSAMCHLVPLSNSCSVFVTSWSLTAISIDKFLHIMDPTKAPVSKRQASFITTFIWSVSTLINYPYFLSFDLVDGGYYVKEGEAPLCGRFCDETKWASDSARQLYGTIVMLLQFVVPMLIISFCYFMILNKVARDSIIQNAQFCHSLSQKQRIDAVNRKKRVNYILIGMVATFIICWLPLTVVNILKDYKKEPDFLKSQPFFFPLGAHVIAMSLVLWNPLLFFWLTRKQKRLNLSRIINTSDIVTSFASRISSLRRSTRSRRSSKANSSFGSSRRPTFTSTPFTTTLDSEIPPINGRPLIIKSTLSVNPYGEKEML